MKVKINNEKVAKVVSIVSIVVAGVSAVVGAISEQQQAKEFEALKEAVAELQKK